MPKYTGHEFLNVLSKTEFRHMIYYDEKYEVEFIYIYSHQRITSYLFKRLPVSMNVCGDGEREDIVRFVGCISDDDAINLKSYDNIQEFFVEQYLKYPVLFNMEINLQWDTMFLKSLSDLTLEHMSIEMYEYLFNE